MQATRHTAQKCTSKLPISFLWCLHGSLMVSMYSVFQCRCNAHATDHRQEVVEASSLNAHHIVVSHIGHCAVPLHFSLGSPLNLHAHANSCCTSVLFSTWFCPGFVLSRGLKSCSISPTMSSCELQVPPRGPLQDRSSSSRHVGHVVPGVAEEVNAAVSTTLMLSMTGRVCTIPRHITYMVVGILL